MRFTHKNQSEHSVDLLFSLALFLLFAVTGISIVLIGSQIYRSTTTNMQETFTSRTALCYVSEKIRQADKENAIELTNPDGFSGNVLSLHETINDSKYTTYIYFHDGSLRELFIKDGTEITPEQGTSLVALSSFTIEETADHLYILSATEQSGKINQIMIHPKSI